MRKVSGEHHVTRFACDRVDNPVGRVSRLKAACCRERRKWIADAPIGFRRLARAQFAAVPDHIGLDAADGGLLSEAVHFEAPAIRERPHRIHLRADRVSVVNEIQQGCQSSSWNGAISASVGCVSSSRPILMPCRVASNRSTSRIARSNWLFALSRCFPTILKWS